MSFETKIKEEIVDPEYEENAKIKCEPEDLPDDLFDDFDNQVFDALIGNDDTDVQDELDELSDTEESTEKPNDKEKSGSPVADRCQEEIERLTKRIERRKKKLAESIEASLPKISKRSRSRSHSRSNSRSTTHSSNSLTYHHSRSRSREKRPVSRSPSRRRVKRERRSISRERHSRRRHSRSRSRGRNRSRSRDRKRRSRSTERKRRSRSIERGRRRSRSRSRERSRPPKPSFLEELAQKFAEKGQIFPLETELEKLKQRKNPLLDETQKYTSPTIPSVYMPTTSNNYLSYTNPKPVMNAIIPETRDESTTAHNTKSEQMYPNYPVDPTKIKVEKDPPVSQRVKVLSLCEDAIEKLKLTETNPLTSKFFYTPTVINRSDIDDKYKNQSPLNQINNVQFKFSSTNSKLEPKQWGLLKLSDNVTKISRVLGFDIVTLMEKLAKKNLPSTTFDNLVDVETLDQFHTRCFDSTATQTDDLVCNTCIIRQLRRYAEKSTQIIPIQNEISTQTIEENDLPIMNTIATLNSSQLLALNDFSEVIKTSMPENATELYRLREKLLDIFKLSQRPPMVASQTIIQSTSTIQYQTHSDPNIRSQYNSNIQHTMPGGNIYQVPSVVPSPYQQSPMMQTQSYNQYNARPPVQMMPNDYGQQIQGYANSNIMPIHMPSIINDHHPPIRYNRREDPRSKRLSDPPPPPPVFHRRSPERRAYGRGGGLVGQRK